jgi:Domain of unknown function (DUF5134)
MLVVAAVSAARLVAARPWQPGSVVIDTDVAHLLMAIAMAGMLAPSLSTLPAPVWEVIFSLMTAWFAVRVVLDTRANGVRALAGGHCAPHLVHSGSMLYMFLALTTTTMGAGMSGMAGMPVGSGLMMTLSYPTIAFSFALILAGYSVWDLDRLSGRRSSLGMARVSLAGVGAVEVPAMAVTKPEAAALPRARSAVPAARDISAVGDISAAEDTSAAPETSEDQAEAAGLPVAEAADLRVVAGGEGIGGRDAGDVSRLLLSPGVTVGCRIAMGVVMAFLLIIAI